MPLTQAQMRKLAELAIAEHKAGQSPLQRARQKFAAMTPEQKAEHDRQATAWATEQERRVTAQRAARAR